MNERRSPLVTELTGKAVQVVDIVLGTHDHLKGRNELTAGSTVSRYTKQPRMREIFFFPKTLPRKFKMEPKGNLVKIARP